MSQTYSFARAIRTKYNGHWHKLHLIVLEDCDADDELLECEKTMGEGDGDRIFEVLRREIGFKDEVEH